MNSGDWLLVRGALGRLEVQRAQLVTRIGANDAQRVRLFSAGELAGEALAECNGEAFALAAALRDRELSIAALRECLGGAAPGETA